MRFFRLALFLLFAVSCSQPFPTREGQLYSAHLDETALAKVRSPEPIVPVFTLETRFLVPSVTASPTAGPTSTPTVSPSPTLSPTPTLHPMQIEAQRQTPYPGSQIVIEQELGPGEGYRRYIASYLSEGLKIYALLTIPNGEMPASGWPALVFNHGYIPPDEYRTTERYVAYVDSLARHDYIVFRIDYRGHDRSEGEATGAYGHPGYTADVLNATAALKSFPQADPHRIGMWGHSMGGFLTLRAMVISPDIRAGVIWAGMVASFRDFLGRRRAVDGVTPTADPLRIRGWRSEWVLIYGSPQDNPGFWNSISANAYLSDISGPLQLHHGTSDDSVPLAYSEALYQQMIDYGQIVELYTYERDDHNLSNSFELAMTRTIEFFDRYLK